MKPTHLGLGLFLIAHAMLFASFASVWLFLRQSDPSFHGFIAMINTASPFAVRWYTPVVVGLVTAGVTVHLAARNPHKQLRIAALGVLILVCAISALTLRSLVEVSAPATSNVLALFTVLEAVWLMHGIAACIALGIGLFRPHSPVTAVFVLFTAAGWALFRVGFMLT